MQESPSGMASASQADPGGFDSRFLLHLCAYFLKNHGNMRIFHVFMQFIHRFIFDFGERFGE